MLNFNPPRNALEFYEKVIHQCNTLIKMNIWTISDSSFNSWASQFQTQNEKFFCACLLSKLIFRSKNQTYSLITSLFQSNLNNMCFNDLKNQGDLIVKLTQKRNDPKIRLTPVIDDDDPPTKSGPLIIRYTKKKFNLNEKWMIWSSKLPDLFENEKYLTIIFVDDFCGTGRQFSKFFEQIQSSTSNDDIEFWNKIIERNIKIIYAPLIAFDNGLNYLKIKYPYIRFTCSELLSSSNNFFDQTYWEEISGKKIKAEDAQNWLIEFWNSKGFSQSSIPCLGYENMALTIGFEHGTPNNTLPIFWQSNQNWKPLLER